MGTPRLPNHRRLNLEHKARAERYAQQVRRLYDELARKGAFLASQAGASAASGPFSFGDCAWIRREAEKMMRVFAENLRGIVMSGISEEWGESNLAQDLVAKRVLTRWTGSDGREEYARYYQTNPDVLKAFAQRREGGMDLSSRVWNLSELSRMELEDAISVSLAPGVSAAELSREVRRCLNDPDLMFRRFRYKDESGKWRRKWKKRYIDADGKVRFEDCDRASYRDAWTGKGYYKSAARNAMRLARTEINMAYRTAERTRWQQMDFVVGFEVKTTQNGRHEEDMCDRLAGKYPKDFKFVGWHPQCMCYAIPILKTEDEFWDLEEGASSVNEVRDVPEGFRDWVKENEARIAKAREKGTAPWFIRDNEGYVEGAKKEGMQDKYIGENLVRQLTGNPVSKEFDGFKTHAEVAEYLQSRLSEIDGTEINVKVNPAFISLSDAKVNASELLKLCQEYRFMQAPLGTIELGYPPSDITEGGVTEFRHDSASPKTMKVRSFSSDRHPYNAIGSSRCRKSKQAVSVLTHEFGHVLYQVRTASVSIPEFESTLHEIHARYMAKVDEVRRGELQDMKKIAKWYLGNYADKNVNEFMAEAFQEYKNAKNPSSFAKEVGRLIDLYFKK